MSDKAKQMLIFILLLGGITSALLVGADLITRERIEANQQAFLQSAILEAYSIPFNAAEVNNIFNAQVETIELTTEDGNVLVFYRDPNTQNVSFQFEGGGVWGPIIGVITLEPDFSTITRITILEQEETPGLGGIIAERGYLNNYVGAKLSASITVSHTSVPNDPNYVDAISGGTRTSERFETILRNTYTLHASVWRAFTEQE